jgi:predicted metal-binding membrane protein
MPRVRAAAVYVRRRGALRGGERDVTLAILVVVAVAWILLIAVLASDPIRHAPAGARAAGGGSSTWIAGLPGKFGMAEVCELTGTPAVQHLGDMPGGHSAMMLGYGVAPAVAMWALMVVAMMLPAAIPAARHLAVNSLRWRRRRAVVTFLAVFLLVWVGLGVLLAAISTLWSSIDGGAVSATALALAAGWQLTVHKRRALRDCHRPSPLPPHGWRATAGVIRFASLNSLACLRSCWAMMVAMGVASSMMLIWMIAITGIVTTEKLAQKPRRATHASTAVLAAGAMVVGAGALIG